MGKLEKMLDFFVEVSDLKRTLRYSSCPENVQEPTAGHSWMVALMVPVVSEELGLNIDVSHAMELAVVHDLAEYVGKYDFDSYLVSTGALSQEDKDKGEEEVMNSIRERFNFGEKLYSLWKEYEDSKTPEARFVKALDKIESHVHVIERGGTANNMGNVSHQVLFADAAVKNYAPLESFLRVVKQRLRPLMEEQGLNWDERYNYPD